MGRRDDIRRRLEAATPTPWVLGDRYPTRVNSRGPYCDTPVAQAQSRANADLIAHAPSDLRDLLAVADAAAHLRHSPYCATNAIGDHPCDCTAGPVLAALDRLDNGGS